METKKGEDHKLKGLIRWYHFLFVCSVVLAFYSFLVLLCNRQMLDNSFTAILIIITITIKLIINVLKKDE